MHPIDVTEHLKAHLGMSDLPVILANQYILLALGSRRRFSSASSSASASASASLLVLCVTTTDLVELHFCGADVIRVP